MNNISNSSCVCEKEIKVLEMSFQGLLFVLES